MNDTVGMIDRLRVKAMSPDRTIRATLSLDTGVLVECRPKSMRSHSESTLAYQVERALAGITAGYDAARQRVRQKADGEMSATAETDDAAARARRRPFQAIEVDGKSERDMVTVTVRSTDEIRVRIAPDAIARCGSIVMMSEINSALDKALDRYREAAMKAFDEVYNGKRRPKGSDHGGN